MTAAAQVVRHVKPPFTIGIDTVPISTLMQWLFWPTRKYRDEKGMRFATFTFRSFLFQLRRSFSLPKRACCNACLAAIKENNIIDSRRGTALLLSRTALLSPCEVKFVFGFFPQLGDFIALGHHWCNWWLAQACLEHNAFEHRDCSDICPW